MLALLALAIGLAYPAARGAADAWAVRAARDAVGAALAGARAAALTQRGAEVLLVPVDGTVLVRSGASDAAPRPTLQLQRDWRVALSSPGFSGDTIAIRYDAIGIGRIANRTLRFERGRAIAGLTVSAYGRVRAW